MNLPEPDSTEQFNATVELLKLLNKLRCHSKHVEALRLEYLDEFHYEYGACPNCGYTNMNCMCGIWDGYPDDDDEEKD